MTELQNLKNELKELKAKETEIKNRIKELESKESNDKIEIPVVAIYKENGSEGVAKAIEGLTVKQLKYVIRNNGLDNFKVTTAWKKAERLKAYILEMAKSRFEMGMGFRYYSK